MSKIGKIKGSKLSQINGRGELSKKQRGRTAALNSSHLKMKRFKSDYCASCNSTKDVVFVSLFKKYLCRSCWQEISRLLGEYCRP